MRGTFIGYGFRIISGIGDSLRGIICFCRSGFLCRSGGDIIRCIGNRFFSGSRNGFFRDLRRADRVYRSGG